MLKFLKNLRRLISSLFGDSVPEGVAWDRIPPEMMTPARTIAAAQLAYHALGRARQLYRRADRRRRLHPRGGPRMPRSSSPCKRRR